MDRPRIVGVYCSLSKFDDGNSIAGAAQCRCEVQTVVGGAGRLDQVADGSELDEVHDTECNLFYVACTRARDCLLVCGVKPASEFFADFSAPQSRRTG